MVFLGSKGINLRIDGRSAQGGASASSNRIERSIKAPLNTESDATKISFGESASTPLGTKPVASAIQGAIGTANNALESIATLREAQRDIAEEASGISYGQRSVELAAESKAIQDEITSIEERATYNDINVLSSSAVYDFSEIEYSADGINRSTTQVVSRADQSSALDTLESNPFFVSGSPGSIGYATPAAADTSTEALNQSLFTLRASYANNSSALEKALDYNPQRVDPLEESSRSGSTIPLEEAENLTLKISAKISSAYFDENEAKQVVEASARNLDPERSRSLLDEA